MNLIKIYKIELLKAFKKPITATLLIPLILPLFYALSMITDASFLEFEGGFNVLLLSNIMWSMLQILGLAHVLFALYVAYNFANELEGGQIKGLLVRGCSRTKLLMSKVLVQLTFLIGTYIGFYLFSFAIFAFSYQIENQFESIGIVNGDLLDMLLADMIYLSGISIIMMIVLCAGLYKRPLSSFLIGVSLHFISLLLQFLPVAKYLSPNYVADQVSTSINFSSMMGVVMLMLYVILAVIPMIVATNKFNKMDIS